MSFELPTGLVHPRAITILGTYRCTAECENCCFNSNPRIQQRLDFQDIKKFLEDALATFPSIETVVFSGGEPFLLGEDLEAAVRIAAQKGRRTRCVSNGFWAKSREAGARRLKRLCEAGLSELNISTGDFHQRWVTEQTVVNAASLGIELGLNTVLMVELHKGSDVTAAKLAERNPELRGLLKASNGATLDMIESPWMPMEALEVVDQDHDRFANSSNVHFRGGCKSIFSTLVVTPSKNVGFCCGLSREKIPELNLQWDSERSLLSLVSGAERDFMKIWIFVDGPERILAWVGSKNPEIEWEGRYAHHCHACLRVYSDPVIRRTIAEHYRERIDDVLMRYCVLLRKQDVLEGEVYA